MTILNLKGQVIPTVPPGDLQKMGGGLPDGYLVTTSAPRAARWMLARNYQTTPNDIRAIAAIGGGAWVRDLVAGSPGANFVAQWYVNQTTGDNLNDGFTPATAVKDIEEIMARLGQQPIDDTYGFTGVVVTVAPGYVSDNKLVLSPRIERLGYLTILGLPTVVASGTLTNHTPWAPASGTVGSYTVSGFSPGSFVGSFVQTGSGLTSPIAKASGSTFRGLFMDISIFFSSEPTNGDSIDVISLNKINADVVLAPTGDGQLIVQGFDLGVTGSNHSIQAVSGSSLLISSIVRGLDANRGSENCNLLGCYTLDCRCHGTTMIVGANVHSSAGGANLASDDGGLVQILDLELSGTIQLGRSEESGGAIIVCGGAALAIADYIGAGALSWPGGELYAYDHVFLLDAVGGAFGYQVLNGGRMYYIPGKLPAFYGTAPAGTGYRLGGADIAAGSLPIVTAGGAVFTAIQ